MFTAGGIPAGPEAVRPPVSRERSPGCSRRQHPLLHTQDGRHLYLDTPV